MERHGYHDFYIIVLDGKYTYIIMDNEVSSRIKIVSDELFDTKIRARFAAIGHITLLEKQKEEQGC